MSFSVSVADRATAAVRDVERGIRPEALAKVAGRAGQQFVMGHFFRLDSERKNKLGGDRTHFFGQAARGTTYKADGTGANVSVNQVGIRQRIQGGKIEPRNAENLTIPARAEAYGKRAREFSDLTFGFAFDPERNRMRPALVKTAATRIDLKAARRVGFDANKRYQFASKQEGGEAYFWLVPRVVQEPDPSAMPSLLEMGVAIYSAINQSVELARKRPAEVPALPGGGA